MSELLVPPLAGDQRSQAIDALAARISGIDLTPILVCLVDLVPAEALPFLAEEVNVVGPLWAYLPDDAARRRAIKESVAWHRAKGSPWSIETALSWAGFVGTVEDTTSTAARWAEYQLELGEPVYGDALRTVLELAAFAAPARAHLVRLYGGYDLRHAVLDRSRCDDAILDDDSGVDVDGVQLSFGSRRSGLIERDDKPIDHAITAARVGVIRYEDRAILDVWRLDSGLMADSKATISHLMTGVVAGEIATPSTLSAHLTYARSQLVLDEAAEFGALDDINSRLDGGVFIQVDDPMRLDGAVLDSHDVQRRPIWLDEFSESGRSALATGYSPPAQLGVSMMSARSGAFDSPFSLRIWSGAWLGPWREKVPMQITHIGG